jgi:ATP-dependent exoDNAse (exonuclease V) alpha subunit
VALNHACQKEAVARYRADNPGAPILSIAAPEEDMGLLNTQQDFEIFAGTRLIGANNETKAVVNGGFLVVTSVSDEGCLVEDEAGEEHELTAAQITRSTRLAWAITITASQSREFGGRVAIWDTESPHFSRAHLYTALTRVKIGEPGCSLVVM